MQRTVIRAGALLTLVTLLLVPPVVVWRIGDVRPPSAGQLRDAWSSGTLDASTAIGVGAAAFTAVWVWLAVVALTEATRVTRGRHIAGTGRQIASPVALVRTLARLAVSAGVGSLPVLSTSFAVAAPAQWEAAGEIPAPPADVPSSAAVQTHVATGRDTPYSIATDVLGDPARREEVVALNAGRCGADGRTWTSGLFPAGMEVLLPADDEVASDAPRVVVAPGDSWWALAEDHLGDGGRWRELHAANVGLPQPSGEVVPADTTVLHPGWTIVVDAEPRAVAPGKVHGSAHEVHPGETLGGIVAEVYDPATAAEADALVDAVFAANVGTTDPVGRALHDPDLIHPGMVLTMPPVAPPPTTPATTTPATTPPATTPPATAPPTTAPASTAPATSPPAITRVTTPVTTPPPQLAPAPRPPTSAEPPREERAPVTPSRDEILPGWVAASSLAGATLLATGLGAVAASRRSRRLRASHAGDHLAEPDPRSVIAERAVRAGSDGLAAARLDLALRALAAQIGQTANTARPHLVVRRPDGSIEVHLDQPRALSTPWVADGQGSTTWILPSDVPLSDLVAAAAKVAPPCPALVTLGHDDAGEILVDLEAVGGLHVEGPAASVEAILRAIAVELSVTPLADLVHVVVTGFDMCGMKVSDRLHLVEAPEEALALARSLSTSDPGDESNTFVRRATAGHEPWEPTVLVAGRRAELAGLDADPRLVVVGPPGRGGWRIGPDGEGWRLEPAGRRLEPCGLSDDDAASVAAFLADAATPLVPGDVVERPVTDPADRSEAEHALLVRVLGTVDVVDRDGTPVDFDRPKALELVAWLAQHRTGASRTAARTALWELDVSNATFSNVVSDARRALARRVPPPDGEEWLARTYAESLPLHPLVALDADVVAAALDRSRGEDDPTAITTLRNALDLVRGAPYTGVHYLWPDAEALPAQLTLLATSVAQELARRCLAHGDVDGVLAATSTGLAVLPGHEQLVCLRMRALSAAGDRSAVRREFAGYERAVLADPWSGGELADPVVSLRNELLGSTTT